ncbi:MAG: hypothetical protein ABSD67_19160 [Terracidiphilus sp.]
MNRLVYLIVNLALLNSFGWLSPSLFNHVNFMPALEIEMAVFSAVLWIVFCSRLLQERSLNALWVLVFAQPYAGMLIAQIVGTPALSISLGALGMVAQLPLMIVRATGIPDAGDSGSTSS